MMIKTHRGLQRELQHGYHEPFKDILGGLQRGAASAEGGRREDGRVHVQPQAKASAQIHKDHLDEAADVAARLGLLEDSNGEEDEGAGAGDGGRGFEMQDSRSPLRSQTNAVDTSAEERGVRWGSGLGSEEGGGVVGSDEEQWEKRLEQTARLMDGRRHEHALELLQKVDCAPYSMRS